MFDWILHLLYKNYSAYSSNSIINRQRVSEPLTFDQIESKNFEPYTISWWMLISLLFGLFFNVESLYIALAILKLIEISA